MKEVVSIAKDFAKISELKLRIAEKEATKMELFNKLGKEVYNTYPAVNLEALSEIVSEVKSIDSEVEALNEQIITIKGLQRCPACNALVKGDMKYCGQCGTKLVEDEPQEEEVADEPSADTEE